MEHEMTSTQSISNKMGVVVEISSSSKQKNNHFTFHNELRLPRFKRSNDKLWNSLNRRVYELWQCQRCGSHQTPQRRAGPEGAGTLCNRCGLSYAEKIRQLKPEDTCGIELIKKQMDRLKVVIPASSTNNTFTWHPYPNTLETKNSPLMKLSETQSNNDAEDFVKAVLQPD